MSVLHQPADDIAAHPPQADHAELHVAFLEIRFRSLLMFRLNVAAVEVSSLSLQES
jgi:hypothetical protein